MGKPLRIAVLGAGPVGLEAALYARQLGWTATVYERGEVADHVRRWGHARLFSPFGWNSTPLGRSAVEAESADDLPPPLEYLTGHEYRRLYLEPLARCRLLKDSLRTGAEVLAVGRSGCLRSDPADDPRRGHAPFRLLVRDKDGERAESADAVIDCTGVYGRPRRLGDGGVPAVGEREAAKHVAYGLDDVLGARRAHYAGKCVLVVGSGLSAAATACDLATLAEDHLETWVIWVARSPRSQPVVRVQGDQLRDRDRLAARANALATRGDGNLEFHGATVIESVTAHDNGNHFTVTARGPGGRSHTWQVERVVACTGGSADPALTSELHPGEPNFFTLGVKGAARPGLFTLRSGFEQVRAAFARLTGKSSLDLYAA